MACGMNVGVWPHCMSSSWCVRDVRHLDKMAQDRECLGVSRMRSSPPFVLRRHRHWLTVWSRKGGNSFIIAHLGPPVSTNPIDQIGTLSPPKQDYKITTRNPDYLNFQPCEERINANETSRG